MQTIVILNCVEKKNSSQKITLPANYLLTNHVYPFNCVQTNEL